MQDVELGYGQRPQGVRGAGHAGAQYGLGRESPCAGAGAGEPLVVDVALQGGDLAVAGGGGTHELEQVPGITSMEVA